MTIDLNSDLGEGFGAWEMGNDDAMLGLASSVNVACGFHAGDSDIMLKTAKLAKERGVSIGAHPGYRDLHGFGRRPVPGLKSSEIETMVAYQIGALQAVAALAGYKVTHVKAHGALSNVGCVDDMTARAMQVIYDDEKDHYVEMAKTAVGLIETDDDLTRMTDAIRAISDQRVWMRNEMFRAPMTADEIAAFIEGNRR